MEYKILESNGVENENIDGAAFNNFSARGQNGIIKGVLNECRVYLSDSINIVVDTGELLIHGFRVKLTSPYSIQRTPSASDIHQHIVAKVTLSKDRTVLFAVECRVVSTLTQNSLFDSESGVHEVEIATFTTGVSGVRDVKRTLPIIGEGDIGGSSVDTPVKYGEGKNSAVSGTSRAIGTESVSIGSDNLAGSKAFTIISLHEAASIYYLDSVEGLEVGDVYSLRLACHNEATGELDAPQRYNFGKITGIDPLTNAVTVDTMFKPSDVGDGFTFLYVDDFVGANGIDEETNAFRIISKPLVGTRTIGSSTIALGSSNQALSKNAVAEGCGNNAYGSHSHSEGIGTEASYAAHSEGKNTKASSFSAHSEGEDTEASAHTAHAEGYATEASGKYSHAEGSNTKATNNGAHSEGYNTRATGYEAHAEGSNTKATGNQSHSEGADTEANQYAAHSEGKNTIASGRAAHAEGERTGTFVPYGLTDAVTPGAAGAQAHSEGLNTRAEGTAAHSEGKQTYAKGIYAHAEGNGTTATKNSTHAEGWNTQATGDNSHSEGGKTLAQGVDSHAEGEGTKALETAAHSEGAYTTASGKYSHAGGFHTIASGDKQTAIGEYNKEDKDSYFLVGCGTSSAPKNAFGVRKDGRAFVSKDPEQDNDIPNKKWTEQKISDAVGGTQLGFPVPTINTSKTLDTIGYYYIRVKYYTTGSSYDIGLVYWDGDSYTWAGVSGQVGVGPDSRLYVEISPHYSGDGGDLRCYWAQEQNAYDKSNEITDECDIYIAKLFS